MRLSARRVGELVQDPVCNAGAEDCVASRDRPQCMTDFLAVGSFE